MKKSSIPELKKMVLIKIEANDGNENVKLMETNLRFLKKNF